MVYEAIMGIFQQVKYRGQEKEVYGQLQKRNRQESIWGKKLDSVDDDDLCHSTLGICSSNDVNPNH